MSAVFSAINHPRLSALFLNTSSHGEFGFTRLVSVVVLQNPSLATKRWAYSLCRRESFKALLERRNILFDVLATLLEGDSLQELVEG